MMTGKEIQKLIQKDCILKGHSMVCPNVSNFFIRECDVLSITGGGYAYEYEVKISRADFFADKKKVQKHKIYSNAVGDWEKKKSPNYFTYVVPKDLVKESELPEYAGLVYVEGENLLTIRSPKMLHDKKPDLQKLMGKFLTLYQQREALGCTLLTHKNREIMAINAKNEAESKERFKRLMEYAETIRNK